jgi:hypothetical protein
MLHDFVVGREFFDALVAFDGQIARTVAAGGCPVCGGPLHRADYPRKPRGAAIAAAGEAFSLRHSLCCGRRGCRRRSLPPSLRFLGRFVYLEAVVLLASPYAQLVGALGAAARATEVPRRTLKRWRTWWRERLPRTATWAELRARFVPPPPAVGELPRSLVERLAADRRRRGEARLGATVTAAVLLLAAELLAPVTTRSVVDGSRFVRGIGPPRSLR